MSPAEWVGQFLVDPPDTVSLIIGLVVVGFVSFIAWYLGTVLAEAVIALIERD